MATAQNAKITLHWLNASRSQRMIWLLNECRDVEYDVKVYKRGSDMLAPATLKQVHPLGKSPTISIEAPNMPTPLVLAESGAISEYLTDYFAQHLVPKRYQEGKDGQLGGETETWLRYRHFMHYAEGSLMTLMLMALLTDSLKEGPQIPFLVKPLTRAIASRIEAQFLNANFKTHFAFLNEQLATSPNNGQYLCGPELTAADIMMSYPLTAALNRKKIDKALYPKLYEYAERLESHPGYKQSIKKIEQITGETFKPVP
ncbi:glutathione S-transferase 1-like [Teratosphaeria destructans]|uniref:Glutathione S-transferase 1-like n=1 Tax=Teratosphaeria destructans TaxID=418781 RepID=A0A9W7SKJ2_9PEZI|nr:glutathione S-transferase 1-like [Teratosphaeria destructans]